MKNIHETDYNGHVNKVWANETGLHIEYWQRGNLIYDGIEYTRDEAIAAAKAILIHYGISYQVGEEVW